jgi:hypothetical protein
MHILDRLSKDLAELMEGELTQAQGKPERLYIKLLLLIGWQRGARRASCQRGKPQVGAEWLGPEEMDDADEETEAESESFAPNDNAALAELSQQSPFTHGNPYPSGLLFRDFQADRAGEEKWLTGLGAVTIHAEAALYVDEVLWLKTLGLATRNASEDSKATNTHLLLLRLCQLSQAPGAWAGSLIRRSLDGKPAGLDVTWFRKTALALREQAKRLGGRISAAARNRREISGPYWLETGGCAEIVGEELSLGDVVGIAPMPLQAGFSADAEFFKRLRRVLQALNETYKSLRACGLPPRDWLHREEFSINRLEELALLRKQARQSEAWINGLQERAFRDAFDALRKTLAEKDKSKSKAPKKAESERKVGGFSNFDDWLDSDIGQAMLREHPLSLSVLFGEEEEDFQVEDQRLLAPASAADAAELYAQILADAGPRLSQDPVLSAFFREVLVADRTFTGPGSLLEEAGFQALLAQHPGYAGLAPDGLAERLFYQANSLIASVLQESTAATAPKTVQQYLHWVLIQEKPFRALLRQKSFQAALAEEPALDGLSEERLAECLHQASLRLLARWLSQDD